MKLLKFFNLITAGYIMASKYLDYKKQKKLEEITKKWEVYQSKL